MPLKKKRNKREKRMDVKIENVNVEIDYEKLAKAIVTAQNKANEQEQKKETELLKSEKNEEKNKTYTNKEFNKKDFWYKVWYIIANRKIEDSNFLTTAIAGIMQLFFNVIAFCLTIFAILCFSCIIYVLFKGENHIYIVNYVIATPVSLMLALIIRGIANEIGREKDKNYIFTAFSGIVGFVALIVALIALFKGVG